MSLPTLAILAGGQGCRMGKPKALLDVDGRPILAHLLDRFRWPGPTLLVTAPGREKPPGHELFTREVVDPIPDEGPLRGVLTALEASRTPITVVATVDMPEISAASLTWLVAELNARADALGIVCSRRGGQIEPFPAAFRQIAARTIRTRLADNERSMRSLARDGILTPVPCGCNWPEAAWTNLNHPGDFERWLRARDSHRARG